MERLGGTGIEEYLHARLLLKLLDGLPVEVAPRLKLLYVLLCLVNLMANGYFFGAKGLNIIKKGRPSPNLPLYGEAFLP